MRTPTIRMDVDNLVQLMLPFPTLFSSYAKNYPILCADDDGCTIF
jgi:hypothetical protein